MGAIDDQDAAVLHGHLVAVAGTVARPLQEAITRVGPIALPRRDRVPFGRYLAEVVIGQQISPAAARTIWSRIESAAAAADEALPGYFRDGNAAAIRGCGVSRAKLTALIGIAEADAAGLFGRRILNALDHGERSARLRQLPGIGPWTCDMASLFYFRAPDIWPEGDLAVQRTFRRLIGRRSPERAAARFTPYRSHLALAMWRLVALDR